MVSRTDISSIPLLPITVCYVIGIVLYVYGWAIPALIIMMTIAVICLFKNLTFSIFSLAGILGLCQAYTFIPLEADPELTGKEYVFSGTIEDCNDAESVQSLIIHLDSAGSTPQTLEPINKELLSVQYPDFTPEFEKGQRLVFKCSPEAITAQYDLPDEIDPSDLLIRKNVYIRAVVTSDDIYAIHDASGITGYMIGIRKGIAQTINESALTPEAKELLTAMLTGETSGISDDIKLSFRKSGLSHLLAISGLHVGIICFVISLALWPLYMAGYGKARWILTIALIWIFAMLTGMASSVVRAVIMATAYMIARHFQRNSPPLNSLCLAALLILLFSPQSLFNVGFLLSFCAVASILIFANRINPISPRHRIRYAAMSYVSVSISAVIGTGLVSIMFFHSFPVYFLLANILISLILPFSIGAGLILVAIKYIFGSATVVTGVANFTVDIIIHISQFVSEMPGSYADNLYFPAYMIIPYLVLLLAFKLLLDKPTRMKLAAVCGLTLVFTILVFAIAINTTPTENRIYLSRDFRHTDIIVCNSESGMTIVTNTPGEPNLVRSRAELRYADYIGKRCIDSIIIDTGRIHSDRLITFGSKKLALLSGKRDTIPSGKINYLVVSKGYRGNISTIKEKYRPDTVIISADIHPKRAIRYADECRESGQPFILARQHPWSIGYPNSVKPIIK